MALPENFNAWQHLLQMIVASHNQAVIRSFTGVPDNDLTNTQSGMKLACLMTTDDTVDMTVLRICLFYFIFQGNLPTPVYGIPVDEYQSNVKFRPQIILFFKEKLTPALVSNQLQPSKARISFRLMNETSATITPAEALTWARKIKEQFAEGAGFMFEKGTIKVNYSDLENGLDLRILAVSEAEGTRVIRKVVALSGHSFNEQYIGLAQKRKTFPVVPPMAQIYGKSRRTPRLRPITEVYFQRAELHVHGVPKAISLIDKTNRRNSLVY
jgi:hypothetical protein